MSLVRRSVRRVHHGSISSSHGFLSLKPAVLSIAKLLFLGLWNLPLLHAHPLHRSPFSAFAGVDDEGKSPKDPSLWAYLGTAAVLVLLGGAFAGLTIALMGQDEIYLQVIATSGEGSEKKNAKSVLRLLKKGKHWVLVTLLLSNVITNETLPIVLDRSLGGGWPAVLSSTVLIVIFGEIAPQSVCVRYGLTIGAWMSPFVLALMWIMAPIAWPTAKLLDWLLGEDHGTTYKKAGLKTLVTLHKTLGTSPDERLNQDEVTIISAVLDLKDKSVGSIMTPMNDVFTLSANAVLDEQMMNTILSAGYSRIPIFAPDNPRNFVGMLLVKILITYDPEDCLRVRDFPLATLPETRPETSCLDIVNFFQEGKSHMVLVSDFPGEPYGALGVVTLEDVIEELIGEEIIDESDVFVDVHKAIRRMQPAPRTRVPKGQVLTDPEPGMGTQEEGDLDHPAHKKGEDGVAENGSRKPSVSELGRSPQGKTFMMRRRSSGNGSQTVPMRSNTPEMRQHLRHLGPSNVASRPKSTRINTVKIKPGVGTIPEGAVAQHTSSETHRAQSVSDPSEPAPPPGGTGEVLLGPGRGASDGVHAVHQGYGTMAPSITPSFTSPAPSKPQPDSAEDRQDINANGEATTGAAKDVARGEDVEDPKDTPTSPKIQPEKIIIGNAREPDDNGHGSESGSSSTVGSLRDGWHGRSRGKSMTARSGSITENLIDAGGVKKLVLETTSSSDGEDGARALEEVVAGKVNGEEDKENGDGERSGGSGGSGESAGKKKRKKRGGKKRKGAEGEESRPLLGDKN